MKTLQVTSAISTRKTGQSVRCFSLPRGELAPKEGSEWTSMERNQAGRLVSSVPEPAETRYLHFPGDDHLRLHAFVPASVVERREWWRDRWGEWSVLERPSIETSMFGGKSWRMDQLDGVQITRPVVVMLSPNLLAEDRQEPNKKPENGRREPRDNACAGDASRTCWVSASLSPSA